MTAPSRKEFEANVLVHIETLYRFAIRLTRGDQSHADDLVQETMLHAWKSFETVECNHQGLKMWLFKILHNIFFNELSTQKRHHIMPDQPEWEHMEDHHFESWPETDIEHIDWEQFDGEVKSAVESLAPEYRIVILLWSLEAMTYKEISTVCGVPVGTVMSRLYRARKELSEKLAESIRNKHRTGYVKNHEGVTHGVS